jgi:hypothetical protein
LCKISGCTERLLDYPLYCAQPPPGAEREMAWPPPRCESGESGSVSTQPAAEQREDLLALRRRLNPDQHPPGFAAAHQIEGRVDVVEGEFVRDDAVEG